MTLIPDTSVPEPLSETELAVILADIADLETKLADYIRSLTEQQRRALPKMGADSVEFVDNGERAIDFSLSYMARDFDPVLFKRALLLTKQLAPISLRLNSLARGVDDAEMVFGSIAYSDALEIYGALGPASKKDSKLVVFFNAMKTRFDKLRGKHTTPPPTN